MDKKDALRHPQRAFLVQYLFDKLCLKTRYDA